MPKTTHPLLQDVPAEEQANLDDEAGEVLQQIPAHAELPEGAERGWVRLASMDGKTINRRVSTLNFEWILVIEDSIEMCTN